MPVYLDHNATTALHPAALEAMLPYLRSGPGNPSSAHRHGRAARAAIDRAREQVAALVGAEPAEVVFTSGGTESNNLAIAGTAARLAPGHLLVGATEHASVLEPAEALAGRGWTVERLAVDGQGRIAPDALDQSLRPDSRLACVMLANNETGVLHDVAALAARAAERGVPTHTDAAQAAGKLSVDFRALGVRTMTVSAHKLHGPQGVGALVVDRRAELAPLLLGGGQERGLRSGTQNVAGIVGFGAAAEAAAAELEARARRLRGLRDTLEERLRELGSVIFGEEAERLPNTVMFALPGFAGETLLMTLDREGLALSSGSACHAGVDRPSHVLAAMGVPEPLALGAVRASLGKDSSLEDVEALVAALRRVAAAVPAAVRLAGGG